MTATPPPRWLDDDERAAWLALVSVFIRLPAELDRQLRRDADLSHFDYQVLARLSDAPRRTLRMSALAELTDASLPRLSQVVARMERRGWVERRPDPSDGRYTLATMTSAGFAKIVEAAPGHVDAVRRLVFDPLSDAQVRQLGTIGRRIVAAIDAAPPDGVGPTAPGSGRPAASARRPSRT